MNETYRHIRLRPDEYLGWVEEDGKVYEVRPGLENYAGIVDLEDGKIYETRLGPEKYLGRVDLQTGSVYINRVAGDEQVGTVRPNGHCHFCGGKSRGTYAGKVKKMTSIAHGGAAFLLLVYPKLEQVKEPGKAVSPAAVPNTQPGAFSGQG